MKGQERQKVSLAAQLLSETYGRAIQQYLPQYRKQAELIINVDSFFDICNTRLKFGKKINQCAFGVHKKEQLNSLDFIQKYFR